MHLTFDRNTRELVNYHTIYSGLINIQVPPFVYVDEYIVVKRDDAIDFIETTFDEASQLETIVPGQYSLTDDDIALVSLEEIKINTLHEGKKLVSEKLEKGFLNSAFLFEKANMALKILNDSATEGERKIFEIDTTVLNSTLTDVLKKAKEDAVEKMRALNSIHVRFEKFKDDVSSSTSPTDPLKILDIFKTTMKHLIPDGL